MASHWHKDIWTYSALVLVLVLYWIGVWRKRRQSNERTEERARDALTAHTAAPIPGDPARVGPLIKRLRAHELVEVAPRTNANAPSPALPADAAEFFRLFTSVNSAWISIRDDRLHTTPIAGRLVPIGSDDDEELHLDLATGRIWSTLSEESWSAEMPQVEAESLVDFLEKWCVRLDEIEGSQD